jgi:hypothetical protein
MTPTFTLKLGTLDLSSYCRMNPDDKFDPVGAPFLIPAFAETPFADSQPLLSTTVGPREQMFPLFLSDPSHLKDQLHTLIRSINIAAQQRPLSIEWKDDGASKPTFWEVSFVRFEPEFNFRRSIHGYAAGVLHVWVAGYGNTGTLRIAATAAGTGVFLSVPIGSIAGDAPALMDTTIVAGVNLPTLGRIVAVAPINNPSYLPLVPAASLLSPQSGATLVGASGAQGSQYLALPVSPTGGASGVACKVPMQNPTIAGGDNRILAVVKSGITGGIGITAQDPYGNVIGPTAVASMSAGWGLVDLGVCRLPTVGYPTLPELSIIAGAVWASGASGPAISASPAGLAVNEVICLPDKNLTLVLENAAPALPLSQDGFPGMSKVLGSNDQRGNPWQAPLNNGGASGGQLEENGGYAYPPQHGSVAAGLYDGDRVGGVLTDSMKMSVNVNWGEPYAEGKPLEVRIFKDVRASQCVTARLSYASSFMSIETATGSLLGNLIASVAVPTFSIGFQYRLALELSGWKAIANLSRVDGGNVFAPGAMTQASVGVASNAAVAGAGAPAVAVALGSGVYDMVQLSSWLVNGLGAANLQAYDAYRFDGPDADVYRTASSGVFSGAKLMNVQRGAFPKAAPSTSSVAIVCAPFDQGAANDLISAAVSVRERFFYAR